MRRTIVLALLLAPTTLGGSPSDPEITDGIRDVRLAGPWWFGATAVLTPEVDMTKGWFDANQTTVLVHWEVVDLAHRFEENEELAYSMHFRCGNDVVDVSVNRYFWQDPDRYPWGAAIWVWKGGELPDYPSYSTAWEEGNVVTAVVPRNLLECTTLSESYALAYVVRYQGGGVWSGYCGLGGFCDVAPDAGYGRDFSFG